MRADGGSELSPGASPVKETTPFSVVKGDTLRLILLFVLDPRTCVTFSVPIASLLIQSFWFNFN